MTQTSTGIKLSISSGIPATYDLSGYGALTYFEIGEVTNIPQFGAQFQTVTNQPLATGITEKRKGFVNYGDPVIDMALDNSNMGQQMMKSACDGIRKSQVHAFMLQYGNGEIRYWSGRVFSFQEAPGSANNMVGATSQIGITRAIIQIPRITLDLSFAENFYSLGGEPKNFSDIITFSRSTTATYFDQNGVMQTAPIDTPCLAYDPSTLEPLGLQVFSAATNLLTYSEQFDNAAWTKSGATVTPDALAAPDGTTTTDKLVEDNSDGSHYVYVGLSLSTAHTQSVFVKAAERSKVRLNHNGGNVSFDLASGAVIGTPTAEGFGISPTGGGWFRVTNTNTGIGSGSQVQILILDDNGNNSYQGDGTSGIYIWGAQLETGSIATPYIKTEASQVTRAADIATVDDLSGWYNQSQGSVFVDAELAGFSASAGQYFFTTYKDSSNFIASERSAAGQVRAISSVDGGVVVLSAGVSSVNSHKVVATYGAADSGTVSYNGSYSSGEVRNSANMIALSIGAGATGGNATKGYIKTLNYYPSALTENEMKLITL